jgi:hypothetical protein
MIKKIKDNIGLNIIAIVSTLGILGWIITDYFGGMILYLISYSVIIIPIIILYLISIVDTIISLIKKGIYNNKIKLIFHASLIMSIIAINVMHSDFF